MRGAVLSLARNVHKGVDAIIDGCQSTVTVMSYGCLSTSLIAFGTVKGGVYVLHLTRSGHKLNKVADKKI